MLRAENGKVCSSSRADFTALKTLALALDAANEALSPKSVKDVAGAGAGWLQCSRDVNVTPSRQQQTEKLACHTATLSEQIIPRCLEYGSGAKQRRITPVLHRKCRSVAKCRLGGRDRCFIGRQAMYGM